MCWCTRHQLLLKLNQSYLREIERDSGRTYQRTDYNFLTFQAQVRMYWSQDRETELLSTHVFWVSDRKGLDVSKDCITPLCRVKQSLILCS